MRIIIDFDNTIAKAHNYPGMGQPMHGVREALEALREAGHTIAIHSCRMSEDVYDSAHKRNAQRLSIAAYLLRHSIPYDEIINYSKPVGDVYIDDKALRFEGNWDDMVDEVKMYE